MKKFCGLRRRAIAVFVLSALIHFGAAGALWAVPLGYTSTAITFPAGFAGAAALAYAADGTLYVVEAVPFGSGATSTTIHVIPPGGGFDLPISLAGDSPSEISIGDIAVDPVSGDLIITDNAPGFETLYSVNPTSGAKTSHSAFVSLSSIDKVAVRSSGEILVGDAVGSPDGEIVEVDLVGTSTSPAVTGLDLPGGIGFDTAGHLYFQEVNVNTFVAEVFRVEVDDTSGSLVYGSIDSLAAGLAAGFDLAVDSEDDVFVSGFGGLFELDRNLLGEFTGTASLFDAITSPFGSPFATGLSFLPGADPFEPFAGTSGGVLAYIPDFAHETVVLITPVPEPSSAVLMAWAVVLFVLQGARRRRVAA